MTEATEATERSLLLPPKDPDDRDESDTSLRRYSSAALPPYHEDYPSPDQPSSTLAIWTVVPVLLVGVFVANADGSLVIASSQKIASDFDALSSASWLVTSYVLAQCASQPLYGKLSDIFGRKSNLAVSYIFFAAGCFLCGIAQTYWQVLTGRAISGVGGAGMTALVSIVISDMVPVRSVAAWRSYVNVAATVGRSLGGPVGGWLTDTIGWRWSFYGQCPLTLGGLVLIFWKIPSNLADHDEPESTVKTSFSQKVNRVDVLGAITFAAGVSAFLLALDFATKEAPWWQIAIPAFLAFFLLVAFYFVERKWAREPILPIELLTKRAAYTSYLIAGFQIAAQFALFYAVPIYFQIAAQTSVAQAGLRLVPAVVGNAVGGLLSGLIISKSGRYKLLTIFASATASLGYLLIMIRWTGDTKWPELAYVFLGGFGTGINQSTTFVHLAASLDASEMAIAGTTLYLAQNLFLLIGIQSSTTVVHAQLRAALETDLEGLKHKQQIIDRAVSSLRYIRQLAPHTKSIVIHDYIRSLQYTYAMCVGYAVIGLLFGLTIRERRL